MSLAKPASKRSSRGSIRKNQSSTGNRASSKHTKSIDKVQKQTNEESKNVSKNEPERVNVITKFAFATT